MALFSKITANKKKEDKPHKKDAVLDSSKKGKTDEVSPRSAHSLSSVLIRPHVTEKAATLTDSGVYAFIVSPDATKNEIRKAVEAVYKKTPRKISVSNMPGKRFMRRAGEGRRPGFRRAYVYLKKGETINVL